MNFRAVIPVLTITAVLRAQEPPKAVVVEEPAAQDVVVPVEPGGNVAQPVREEVAVSQSGMFRVRGGDSLQRASIALELEQVRGGFLSLIRERTAPPAGDVPLRGMMQESSRMPVDEFRVPVVVEIVAGDENDRPPEQPVEFGLTMVEGGFSLGIRIHAAPGIDHDLLERAGLTALLYERALRTAAPDDLEEPLLVRPWLVEGLVEARKWGEGQADRRLYEGVFRRGGGFTMDELFELGERAHRQLDSASRLSFRALSGALVMALLEQPQGREAFRNFCGEAARHSGEMSQLLRKYFPELNLSERSLAKWWALTLAKLVQPTLTEVLSVAETESELAATLRFHLRDSDGHPTDRDIHGWADVIALPTLQERVEIVRPVEDGLVRLSYRCFPSYRPIIQEYQLIVRDLAAGRDDQLGARLAELEEERLVRVERANRARDYLHFFEISRAREISGEFDDYMRLKKELEHRQRPVRNDRLSGVLDTMDRVFDPKPGR